jgi:DNA polymerase
MEKLIKQINDCVACPLCEGGGKAVPGEGAFNKKIMIIGEAPGRQEAKTGKPFQGKAGELLNRVLEGAGLERDDFFITNIVKHRPPENRNPSKEEIITCFPFIEKQINNLRPGLIVTLGKVSSQFILNTNKNMREMRGQMVSVAMAGGRYSVFPSLHPAAAIYDWKWEKFLDKDFATIKNIIDYGIKKRLGG